MLSECKRCGDPIFEYMPRCNRCGTANPKFDPEASENEWFPYSRPQKGNETTLLFRFLLVIGLTPALIAFVYDGYKEWLHTGYESRFFLPLILALLVVFFIGTQWFLSFMSTRESRSRLPKGPAGESRAGEAADKRSSS